MGDDFADAFFAVAEVFEDFESVEGGEGVEDLGFESELLGGSLLGHNTKIFIAIFKYLHIVMDL